MDMEPRTEHTGLSAADRRGGKGIRTVAAAWSGALGGCVGRVEHGGDPCVSGLRPVDEAARRVGDLALDAAPVLPAHLTMAAGRKVAELKRAPLLLVERAGRLVGVVDRNALRAAPGDDRLGDAMKRLDVCLTPLTALARARELFIRTGAAALPVAAGALLLGVVSRAAVGRAARSLERLEVARPGSRLAPPAAPASGKPAHRRHAA